ncbi:hypothetical protein HYC85_011455 [Camellia sinensis]|uniref:F-box associated beta-propeller type 3 domain-containing protein n=1 Tax=Camellia sinensis TaxID=4442 RepID=A0A7J7H934_CAMSI|nr:hypothetical protein HYC85_011455 [Camellia sinensis]
MHLSRASSPSLILQTKTPKDGLPYDLYLAEPTTCHSNDAVTTISTKFNRSNLEFDLVGSINGLLCLSEPLYFDPVYICNPIIGEYMTLPKSEIETGFDIVSGFGFDQSTDRYKVIIMLYVTVKDDPTTTNGTVSFRMEGEIYTVGGSGEWRRIGEVPYPLRARESEAYLNGVLHWLMTDQDIGIEICEFIGSFDVASEEFRSLPPPQTQFSSESRTSLRRLNLDLGVLGDELCIFDNYFSDRTEIWMMKDYGVQSSWTKQYVIKRPRSLEVQQDTRVYFKPLKLTHNGEILMLYDSVAIVCYNPVGKNFYHLGLFGLAVGTNVCKAIVHVGSLVSLRNVAANEGENSNTAVDKSVKRVDVVDESAESRKNSDIPYGTWDTILYPIPTQ